VSVPKTNPLAAECILLHPTGGADVDLLGALSRRSIAVRASGDRCHAMAQLCLAARRGGPVVLLLDRLEHESNAQSLAASAHRYVAGLTIWTYDPKGKPQLRAYVEPDEADESEMIEAARAPMANVAASRPGPVFRGGPKLRLTDDPPVEPKGRAATSGAVGQPAQGADASENDESEAPAGLSGLLTDEELAMLLADEPGRGHTGGV
jgi:hypothetical protein